MSAAPDPIAVTLTIGLDTPISDRYVQTGEDDYRTEPVTVMDAVIERTAALLAKQAMDVGRYDKGSELSRDLRARAFARIDHEINKAVEPIIAGVLDGSIRRTNTLGEPVGEPVTLRELVIDAARKQMATGKNTSYGSQSKTAMDETIAATAKSVIANELAAEIEQAKATVKAALAQSVGETMADTITKAMARP